MSSLKQWLDCPVGHRRERVMIAFGKLIVGGLFEIAECFQIDLRLVHDRARLYLRTSRGSLVLSALGPKRTRAVHCKCPLFLGVRRTSCEHCGMSANDPKRTSNAGLIPFRVQKTHFFTLDLFGGEPAWQVLHGLP